MRQRSDQAAAGAAFGRATAAPSWPRARRWLFLAAALALLALVAPFFGMARRTELALHDGLQLLAAVVAAWSCADAGRRLSGHPRAGYFLLGSAAAAWALGQVVWTWYEVGLGVPVPFPGLYDLGYLAMYPLAVAGLLLLTPIAGRNWVTRTALVLDGGLAALAVSVLAWPVMLHGIFRDAGSTLGSYVTVAYPISDIVLLGLIGGIMMRDRRAWGSALGLAYGAFWMVLLADLGYATGIFQGSYATGGISDVGWILGFLILAAAARAPLPAPGRDVHLGSYARVVGHALPMAAVLVGMAAVAVAQRVGEAGFLPWRIAVGLLLLAALARQGLAALEHVAAERARVAVQANYKALFDNMPEGVVQCRLVYQEGRPTDFVFILVNGRSGPITGLHDMVGRRVSELLPGFAETNADLLAMYGRVATGGPPEHLDSWVPALGGWFHVTAYGAGADEFVAVFSDITDRKVAEERLRFQAHLLESVSQAVTATDIEGRVTSWNPAAERLFGWTRTEAIGQHISRLWGEALDAPGGAASSGGISGDHLMSLRDGRTLVVNVASSPLLDPSGALQGFIAISQDVTEARGREELLRRRERAIRLTASVREALLRAADEEELLRAVCRIGASLDGYGLAWVGMARDSPGHPVEPVAIAGDAADYVRGIHATWDDNERGQLTGKCIREGRTVVVGDVRVDLAFSAWKAKAATQGFASSISLFLPIGPQRGAWVIYARKPDAFGPEEVSMLEGLASDLAFGLRALRLRASEQRLAAMLNDAQELAHLGGWDFDVADGRFHWTPEVFRIHEVPESFDPGDADRNAGFYERDDRRRIDAAFRAALEVGTPYDLELRLRTAKGRLRYVRTMGLPEMRDGKVVRVRGNILDITEQKEAADALRRKSELLEAAEATAHLGSWELDIPGDRLWWSDEVFRIFEINPGHRVPTYEAFLAVIHPEDRKRVDEAFRTSLAARTPYASAHRLLMPDGRVKHVLEQGHTEYGPDGKPVRSIGTVLDVTDREANARLVKRQRDELERAQAAADIGSWEEDLRTGRAEWSDHLLAIAGLNAGTTLDHEILMTFVHPDDAPRVDAFLRAALENPGRSTASVDHRIVRRDGVVRFVHDEVRIQRDGQGKPIHLAGTVQDVTAWKDAEAKARQADAEKLRADALEKIDRERVVLINTMAHELNNPLTPLKLQVAVLRAPRLGSLNEGQAKAIGVIERSVDRLVRLVTDLLDVSRVQAGKLKVILQPGDAASVCRDVVASQSPAAKEAGLTLVAEGPETCPIPMDEDRMVQVLLNLVSNAIKFTPKGGRVTVGFGPVADRVEIFVRDTGLGLTPEQIEALFRPFSQVQGAAQATKGGLGLGLFISKGIVESHGGTLRVESAGPGTGSTFMVSLPVKPHAPTIPGGTTALSEPVTAA